MTGAQGDHHLKEPELHFSNYKVSWKTKHTFKNEDAAATIFAHLAGVASAQVKAKFIVVRMQGCPAVYSVLISGFVNCTGLPSRSAIQRAVDRYKNWFDLSRIEGFRIDCMAAHCNLNRPVQLSKVQCPDDDMASTQFCSEVFPGVIIRIFTRGSATVYGNGKITLVGGRTEAEMRSILHKVLYILRTSALRHECTDIIPVQP